MPGLDPVGMIQTAVTTPPYNYIVIPIIVIAAVAYLYFAFFKKEEKQVEEFQIEDFRESVYIAVEKLMNTFGIKINATLTRGIEPVGKICKFYNFKGKVSFTDPTTKEKKKETKDVDLWIFQLGKSSFWDKIFGGSEFTDFVILEKAHLGEYDGHKKRWPVKESISFLPYGNVFISSDGGAEFINDISFRRSQEEMLTHLQNYARKVAYIELKQAKTMERLDSSLRKKNVGYENYKKNVLATGKDIEDEDEDE